MKRASMIPGTRPFLLDVSRLLWRSWSGYLPTGIDRVCIEYVRRFKSRSHAVVQFRGAVFILSARHSDWLFSLLLEGKGKMRLRLLGLLGLAFATARRRPDHAGMVYLNVGHTGLHDPALPTWISANGVKAVYLVHDLIPITHPQFCRPAEADRHVRRIEHALSSATGVIANSKATLEELQAFATHRSLKMPRALASWIAGHSFSVGLEPTILERPYFITLGTIEARKNHLLLLRVWRRLVDDMGSKAPILIIAGQRGWEADAALAILDSGEMQGHVRELPRCGDQELGRWLRGARALLMPSFVEGFGLPIVEALDLGVPVIASDLPVYREVAGDIPTYLSPTDADAWEAAIRSFAADGHERRRQVAAARDFQAPTWKEHFSTVEPWLNASTSPTHLPRP